MPEIVFRRDPSELGEAIQNATGDLGDLLDLIGSHLVAASAKAFQKGGLAGAPWQQQYPNQSDAEFVNLAGAIADLNKGTFPPARRFSRKKALTDKGDLARSVAATQTGPNEVQVGTTMDYASTQFFGLQSTQQITDAARETFAKWLRRAAGKKYASRLASALKSDELVTQVNARPFLGIPPETEKRIRRDTEDFFVGRLTGEAGHG